MAAVILGFALVIAAAFVHPAAIPSASAFEAIRPNISIPVPGLRFSEVTEKESGEKKIIDIPYLADYIAGVYRFGVGIASIIAAIMMMVGGFRWLTAGGDSGKVAKAKENIKNALIGLALSLGAYTILYTVNPDLVTLDGITIEVVDRQLVDFSEIDSGGVIPDSELGDSGPVAGGPGCSPNVPVCGAASLGSRDARIADCRRMCNAPSSWPRCNAKTIDESATRPIPNDKPGLKNPAGHTATPAVIGALEEAGRIADAQGYFIRVGDGFRPLTEQIQKVCNKINAGQEDDVGPIVAWPGGSNHGAGYAVDVRLFNKATGRAMFVASKCGQCASANKAGADTFVTIMSQAGFYRYTQEVWHFEFGGPVTNRVCKGTCPFPPPICSEC